MIMMMTLLVYLRADGWYGIYAGGDPQTVAVTQLLPLPTVEADPGRVPAGGADGDLQLHPGGDHDGAEGETVGTDGRHHDGRHAGVDHAGSGSHSVGRAARGSGDDQPVTLREDYHQYNSAWLGLVSYELSQPELR